MHPYHHEQPGGKEKERRQESVSPVSSWGPTTEIENFDLAMEPNLKSSNRAISNFSPTPPPNLCGSSVGICKVRWIHHTETKEMDDEKLSLGNPWILHELILLRPYAYKVITPRQFVSFDAKG